MRISGCPILSTSLQLTLAIALCRASTVAGKTLAVPSSSDGSVKRASPPAGPLPDPIDFCSSEDDDAGCTADGAANGGTKGGTKGGTDGGTSDVDGANYSDSAPPSARPSANHGRKQLYVPHGKMYCPKRASENYDRYYVWAYPSCFRDMPHNQRYELWDEAISTSADGGVVVGSSSSSSYAIPYNSFVAPQLRPGQLTPVLWRSTGRIVSQYAFHAGYPPELIEALLGYASDLGVSDLLMLPENGGLSYELESRGRFLKSDGQAWFAQPRNSPRSNAANVHVISPADERTHEQSLRALARGNFDLVLETIGDTLRLDGLAVYHFSFEGWNYDGNNGSGCSAVDGDSLWREHASLNTNGGAYKVVVPLLVDDENPPELLLWDDNEDSDDYDAGEAREADRYSRVKFQIGMGVVMGDNVMHGMSHCIHRNATNIDSGGGVRLVANVYIGEIYEENANQIADWGTGALTTTRIFPLNDGKWFLAQKDRHWQKHYSDSNNYLVGDIGRKEFRSDDILPDCEARAEEGLCENDVDETRAFCTFSCEVYIEERQSNVHQH